MRIGEGPTTNVDGLYEIRNGRMFSRGVEIAADVGTYQHIQLFNPVGSGITVIVRRVLGGPLVDGSIYLSVYNTALGTLDGVGTNLDVGEAAAICEVRTANDATPRGTPFGRLRSLGTEGMRLADDWLIKLSAGEGFLLRPAPSNVGVGAWWEWMEF